MSSKSRLFKWKQVVILYEFVAKMMMLVVVVVTTMMINMNTWSLQLVTCQLSCFRVFTYSDFALFKVVAYWLFLQFHPALQQPPNYYTVLSYFNRYLAVHLASSLVSLENYSCNIRTREEFERKQFEMNQVVVERFIVV